MSLLLAISKGQAWGWTGTGTVTLLALGAAALIVFVLVERRVTEPLIDMRLMGRRGVWATDLVALILGFAMFGTFLLVPTLLQLPAATGYGLGKSVSQAGLFLLPTVLMMIVFGPLAGLLDRRRHLRTHHPAGPAHRRRVHLRLLGLRGGGRARGRCLARPARGPSPGRGRRPPRLTGAYGAS